MKVLQSAPVTAKNMAVSIEQQHVEGWRRCSSFNVVKTQIRMRGEKTGCLGRNWDGKGQK